MGKFHFRHGQRRSGPDLRPSQSEIEAHRQRVKQARRQLIEIQRTITQSWFTLYREPRPVDYSDPSSTMIISQDDHLRQCGNYLDAAITEALMWIELSGRAKPGRRERLDEEW